MKYLRKLALLLLLLIPATFPGCTNARPAAEIAATTLPVYQFTVRLCQGTGLSVTRLVTQSVSCLHDYTLQLSEVKAAEAAQLIVISGAGLEDFMEDILRARKTLDASEGIPLLPGEDGTDPHIWLAPENAKSMVGNICQGLCTQFPEYREIFLQNCDTLNAELTALQSYGQQQLSGLNCRELVTFHDGFSYFADAFDLTILAAMEEESGSEAPAQTLITLTRLVQAHRLPALFVERNGADAAAKIIAAETGAKIFTLDMAMAGDDYFSAMYANIDALREALKS